MTDPSPPIKRSATVAVMIIGFVAHQIPPNRLWLYPDSLKEQQWPLN